MLRSPPKAAVAAAALSKNENIDVPCFSYAGDGSESALPTIETNQAHLKRILTIGIHDFAARRRTASLSPFRLTRAKALKLQAGPALRGDGAIDDLKRSGSCRPG